MNFLFLPNRYITRLAIGVFSINFSFTDALGDTKSESINAANQYEAETYKDLPKLEKDLKFVETSDGIKIVKKSESRASYLLPAMQVHLSEFIKKRGNPITGVVVVDAKTGHILAMVDGKSPDLWGGGSHTTLHAHFPAASLFKTVVATAAIEIANLQPNFNSSLIGGCSTVRASGSWMSTPEPTSKTDMSLRRAYGYSCNGFFAKLAVNQIGLGPILDIAKRFRWEKPIPSDFFIPQSPIETPNVSQASAHTVGKFAAGFGNVGSSVMHIAWQSLVIASGGTSIPLKLFKDSPENLYTSGDHIIEPETAKALLQLMDATIHGGTASSAFSGRRFSKIRPDVGGKTGTLTGSSPPGLTTWFAGVYPLSDPEIVVSAVTVIEDRWIFKAPQLAAEAIASWVSIQNDLRIAKLSKGNKY